MNSEEHEWILEPQGTFQNSKESSQKWRDSNSNESDSVNTFTPYAEFCLEQPGSDTKCNDPEISNPKSPDS